MQSLHLHSDLYSALSFRFAVRFPLRFALRFEFTFVLRFSILLMMMSKSSCSPLRLLLLCTLPGRLSESRGSLQHQGRSLLPTKHHLQFCSRHCKHGRDGGHCQGGTEEGAVAAACCVTHRFSEQGDALISFRINVLPINPEEDDG